MTARSEFDMYDKVGDLVIVKKDLNQVKKPNSQLISRNLLSRQTDKGRTPPVY